MRRRSLYTWIDTNDPGDRAWLDDMYARARAARQAPERELESGDDEAVLDDEDEAEKVAGGYA